MRSSMPRVAEVVLALAAAVLLAALAAPWPGPELPSAAPAAVAPPPVPERAVTGPWTTVPPESVVALFVERQPQTAEPSARAAAPSRPAPWLRYLGRSSDADGTTRVFVKDTRSGAVIAAVRGRENNGWTLVDEDGTSVTLRRGDELYSVPRR
jgi:hypothetical protein